MKKRMTKARVISYTALFAALMAIGAFVSIPIFAVPISLQTLFLYLCVLLLKDRAFLSQAAYLAMGAAGLPVFARGMAGYTVLIGPTGGFLMGFLVASVVSGFMISKWEGRKNSGIISVATCMVIVFSMGWLWLSYWMGWNFMAALWAGVIPFLPGDILKAAAALAVSKKLGAY